MGVYSDSFRNGMSIGQAGLAQMQQNRALQQQAYLRMQEMQAQALYRQQQEKRLTERYAAQQKQREEEMSYKRTRDDLNRASREKVAGMRTARGGGLTPAERAGVADQNANRFINSDIEYNTVPSAGIAEGTSANAEMARAEYFADHPDESPGPADAFTGGTSGFKRQRGQIDVADKALRGARTKYDATLAGTGLTQKYLDALPKLPNGGTQIPFLTTSQQTDDEKKKYLDDVVIDRGPGDRVQIPQSNWRALLGARQTLDDQAIARQGLPSSFPDALPGNIQDPNMYQDQPPAGTGAQPARAALSGGVVEPPLPTGGANSGIVVVNSPEEAMRLPSGTKFSTPDGKIKTRP